MHKRNKLNEKYDFPFPLLADEDSSEAFSFGDLKFMGKDTTEFTELLLSSMNCRCEVITRSTHADQIFKEISHRQPFYLTKGHGK
jgi:peroxiredoxin